MIAVKCDLCGKFEVGNGSIISIEKTCDSKTYDKICIECCQKFIELRNKLKDSK